MSRNGRGGPGQDGAASSAGPVVFLDANASVPPLPAARAALLAALEVKGNPSSTHAWGRAARRALDAARDAVAAALGGAPREVVLLSGASEANRWLADAVATWALTRAATGQRTVVVTSPLEHPSLARCLARLATLPHVELRVLPTDGGGVAFPAADLADAHVVFCTAAHNETGIVPDLEALLGAVRDDAVVCVDAAQAVARRPVLPTRVDAVVASGHKVGGYAGAGALLLRGNARRLSAPWAGGGQEAGLRPGTEALVLHAAFSAAVSEVGAVREAHGRLTPLRLRLEGALMEAWGARIVGGACLRLSNTAALVVPGVDGDALRIAIDAAGVAVGFGAACSALAPEPSPSLLALGLSPAEARATVRVSLAPDADEALVDEALRRLEPVGAVIARSRRARARSGGV